MSYIEVACLTMIIYDWGV
ncbi:hypothetical protein AZE42_12397 [Rhizopogon vesiculosus]|uniref:Uncharacterized protein n=1 Tax=Rhizopogon vesiculosus TaxID=180088 RepID=A0A1J8Q7Z5_9AGAM|nr:hypothetical protein AZE42_12397 [Rhizopogon vesiculosus]